MILNEFQNILQTANKKELIEELKILLSAPNEENFVDLQKMSKSLREKNYGNKVFFRGLLEISSFCKQNCHYCGLNCSNHNAVRFRLSEQEILSAVNHGFDLGLRTVVLQGGDDPFFDDTYVAKIVEKIKILHPNMAVTLSLGEKSFESYKTFFNAGADRYLLRHETANEKHYQILHDSKQLLSNRKKCLFWLKEIGFQVGSGFMVDSPFQSEETLADDLIFLRELQPEMVGIGPFIPQKDTMFADFSAPNCKNTLTMLAIVRILLPKSLIPATTALATIDEMARFEALKNSANVLMPNLSPEKHKKDYAIYDNKKAIGFESVQALDKLSQTLKNFALCPDFSRGDHLNFQGGKNE